MNYFEKYSKFNQADFSADKSCGFIHAEIIAKPLATTMKKILLIILIGISNLTFSQIGTNLSGKIVDEKLNCLFGVKITNLNTRAESISDQNGRYKIIATENDTLEFQMIGLTTDKIKIEKPTQTLNLIMMDKDVNCLGAIWTDKQYRRAYRGIEKRLEKLYKTAEKQNVWKNSSCQQRL